MAPGALADGGAGGEAADAEAMELGGGGEAGPGEDVEREAGAGGDGADLGFGDERGDEEAVGAGVAVTLGAGEGLGDALLGGDEAREVDVGARVDEEVGASGGGGALDVLDLGGEQLGRRAAVLEVDTDDAGLDELERAVGDARRIARVAALEVDGQRDGDNAGDRARHRDQAFHRQAVAVGIALRPGDAGAGGGEGRGTQALDEARAARVPAVGQNEELGTGVQAAEAFDRHGDATLRSFADAHRAHLRGDLAPHLCPSGSGG